MGLAGAVPEPVEAVLVLAAPGVERLAADALGAAGQRDVAGDLLGVGGGRQATLGHPGQPLLGPRASALVGGARSQPSRRFMTAGLWRRAGGALPLAMANAKI